MAALKENGGSPPPSSAATPDKNGGLISDKHGGTPMSPQPQDHNVGPNDITYASHNPKITLPRKPTNAERITLDNLREMKGNINNMATSLCDMSLEDVLRKLHLPVDSPQPDSDKKAPRIKMLSTISREEILAHLHHEGTAPPPVRPCDTVIGSDI